MRDYGLAILIACASSIAVPAAHAESGFFLAGQNGRIQLSDSGFYDDKTDISGLGLGYRWQAGSVVQVGFELGGGKLGTLEDEYTEIFVDGSFYERETLETSYVYAGANARFQFGVGSPWFGILRLGYMRYEEEYTSSYEDYYAWDEVVYSGSYRVSDVGGGAYFGAGIGFDFTSNFNLNLTHSGYAYSPSFGDTDTYADDFYTASSTTLGLELRF